jgi:DNA transformation protein
MSTSAGLPDQIVAALDGHGLTRTRRMFGGIALFNDEQIFGLVFDGALFLRVNEVTRKAYERAGMPPLQIPGVQKPSSRYMQVPPKVLQNAASLRAWARQALATSVIDAPRSKRPARKR